jgi:rhodanese-related sulfurtransferase
VHSSVTPGDRPAAIDRLLQRIQAELDRVHPADLAAAVAAGALVVDIRPVDQRRRDGDLPGAIVVDRNVLEWRLDPTCCYRLPVADDPGRRVILVCNEGYSSSLAAASLQQLGLRGTTDLVGGFQEWMAVTQTVAPPSGNSVIDFLAGLLGKVAAGRWLVEQARRNRCRGSAGREG